MAGDDRFFGGRPGAAKRALEQLKRAHGPKDGQTVYRARIIKQKKRAQSRKRPI